MMNTPIEVNDLALLERHLERQALQVCRSATVMQCLKDHGLDPIITVTPPATKEASETSTISIRAGDIAALKKRFFEQVDLDQNEYPLSTELTRIVDLYEHFVLNEHTPRYRLLVSLAQRQWLRQVITLVVIRSIMEQKYESASVEGCHPFADSWVGNEMARLMLLRTLPGMVAQLVHHVVKEPDQAQEMIEQLYISIDMRMKGHVLISPEHLSPLPKGTSFPFALPAYKKKEEKPQDE